MSRIYLRWLVVPFLAGATFAHAASLPGFFNTGVDNAGVPIATGAVDPHFRLIASADPAHPGPNALAAFPIPAAYWLANNSLSRWIAPATDEDYPALGTPHPGGDYTYRFTFDLTGYDASTVVVTGSWGVDNSGSIRLNGLPTGINTTNYNPLSGFSIIYGFVDGINQLDFVVTNYPSGGSNPTGLRVQGFAGTANAVASVPGHSELGTLELSAPFPNPARQVARIAFVLPREGDVRLVVRDLAGRVVHMLANGTYPAGRSESVWNGAMAAGTPAPSGIYFAELAFGGHRLSRRLVWMR